jgi:hypothetical protein
VLDNKIDDLYRLPLADFTRERNALAKSVGGADAQQIKALAKPTVLAWAVNQVYWRARELFDRVMKGGEKLRHAQIATLEGKHADVRAASDAHRRAIADAVAEAERLAAASGSKPSPDQLARTFEALSIAASPPEQPGRLTDALQPAGFEALAGVTPQASPASARAGHPRHEHAAPREATSQKAGARAHPDHDRRQSERERAAAHRAEEEARAAAAAAHKREAELHKAEAAVARAEAAEKLARASWEQAHDALLEARRKRDEIKRSRV